MRPSPAWGHGLAHGTLSPLALGVHTASYSGRFDPQRILEAMREFAIDNVAAKMHLIATCVRDRLRIVSAMGAAARLDPTQVRVADLSETRVDPFASRRQCQGLFSRAMRMRNAVTGAPISSHAPQEAS